MFCAVTSIHAALCSANFFFFLISRCCLLAHLGLTFCLFPLFSTADHVALQPLSSRPEQPCMLSSASGIFSGWHIPGGCWHAATWSADRLHVSRRRVLGSGFYQWVDGVVCEPRIVSVARIVDSIPVPLEVVWNRLLFKVVVPTAISPWWRSLHSLPIPLVTRRRRSLCLLASLLKLCK